jgi:replicative DNA helicase
MEPSLNLVAPHSGGLIKKIPPQNLEAEQAVLASILLDNSTFSTCLEILKPEDFYKEAHGIIYAAMIDLTDKNEPVDLLTLSAILQQKNQLDKVGGSAYLALLVDQIATASHVASYAKLIREKSLVRRLISASSEIVNECYQTDDVGQLLDKAEHTVFALSEQRVREGFSPVKDLVKGSYKLIEQLYERKSHLTGLTTGFKDLDMMTSGLQPSDLIIVAGRPSMGKTAFVLNIASNAARIANAKVAVFSLEMAKDQLVMRMLTSEARIDSGRVKKGALEDQDWPKLLTAADHLAHMKVFIDDQPAQSTLEVRAKSRRLAKEQGGLDLIIVDYLQLMRSAKDVQSREQEISEISRSLKALAKELNCPVIALSQLNRSVEARTNKRPMMSDLRESGAIEQDADLIAFIYRDEVYDPNSAEKGVAEIIIGKQRNGAIGTAKLAFIGAITKFEDLIYQPQAGGVPDSAADDFGP